jgi:uncharacterized protein (TIGR00255 family)
VTRGKIDCRLFFNEGVGPQPAQRLNREAVERFKALAGEVRAAFPDAGPLRLGDVLRWPGIVAEPAADEDAIRKVVDALCRRALDDLVATRSREGAKLAESISARVEAMRRRLADVAPLVPQAVAAYQARLAERLREALGTADDDRVRAEIAVFAAKVDIDEELTRLHTHLAEVERSLARGGALGKRLDFLAQELNREANTLGSKAASQPVSDCALELKLLIEQMREQVQNLE